MPRSRKPIEWTVEIAELPESAWIDVIVGLLGDFEYPRNTKPAAESGETQAQRASERGSERAAG